MPRLLCGCNLVVWINHRTCAEALLFVAITNIFCLWGNQTNCDLWAFERHADDGCVEFDIKTKLAIAYVCFFSPLFPLQTEIDRSQNQHTSVKKKPQKIYCDFCIFVSPTHAIWFLCIQSTPYGVRKIDKQLSTNAMAQRFINNPLLLAQARLKMWFHILSRFFFSQKNHFWSLVSIHTLHFQSSNCAKGRLNS